MGLFRVKRIAGFRQMCLGVLMCACYISHAKGQPPGDWQPVTEKQGISVYQKNLSDSDFHAIRGRVRLDTGLRHLVAFLQDETINTQWVPYSGGAELLERPVPQQSLVYFVVEASWPFSDRDAIALFEISQQPDMTLTITMASRPDHLPESPGKVRMQTYEGYWQLTPVSARQTDVLYQNHVEPGGNIPSWLANRVAVDTTWQALANIRAQLSAYQNPEAVNGRLRFIREPDDE